MRKLRLLIIAMLALTGLLIGCARGAGKIFTAEVISARMCPDMTLNNPTETSGLYNDGIYYVEETNSEINIRFADDEGKEVHRIILPVGKGPGELRFMVSMRIYDDKIYTYDAELQKIAIFDMNGDSLDELNINDDIGMFGTLDVMDGFVYYHALFKNKLVKIDLKDGSVLKKLEYDDPQTDLAALAGKKMLRGTIKADPLTKHLFVGYYNEPYRIEEYDADLNLLRTYTRKLNEKYDPLIFTAQRRAEGNLMITTLNIDSRYVVACFGGGNRVKGTNLSNLKIETIDKNMFLSVFDKESGKFLGEITIDKIPLLKGVAGVMGMDNNKIVLNIIDMNGTLDGIDVAASDKDVPEIVKTLNIKSALVFVKNPLSYE